MPFVNYLHVKIIFLIMPISYNVPYNKMIAKTIILIYTASNAHPNFGNLVVGMSIFKCFKAILRSVFLVLPSVLKDYFNVS